MASLTRGIVQGLQARRVVTFDRELFHTTGKQAQ